MKFLIDESLPASLGQLFRELGGEVACVYDDPALRGKPDEAIFEHAVAQGTTIVTRDLGFANPTRFPLSKLTGLVIIRFPNEISTMGMSQEISRLVRGLSPSDFTTSLLSSRAQSGNGSCRYDSWPQRSMLVRLRKEI